MAYNAWEPVYVTIPNTSSATTYTGVLVKPKVDIVLNGIRMKVVSGSTNTEAWTVNGSGSTKTLGTQIVSRASASESGGYCTRTGLNVTLTAGLEYAFIFQQISGTHYFGGGTDVRTAGPEFDIVPDSETLDVGYYSASAPSAGAGLGATLYAISMEIMYSAVNVAPNPPTNLAVSSTETAAPRLSWTFSDPDVGDTQSNYQVEVDYWTGSAWASFYSSIEPILSTNQYHDISGLAANTQYRFRVRTSDNHGLTSLYSGYYTWTTGAPYATSGTYTSEVLNPNRGGAVNSGTLLWSAVVPSGTTLTADYSTSADNITWSGWTAIANGGAIAPVNYVRVRFNFAAPSGGLSTPELQSWTLAYPQEYYASGEWISPVIDTGSVVEAYQATASGVDTPNGGTVGWTYQYSADNVSWSAWTAWANPLPTWARYLRAKYVLSAPANRLASPAVQSLVVSAASAYADTGVWTSPAIDIRGVSPAVSATWVTTGTVQISYRLSSNSASVGWTGWTVLTPSGSAIATSLSVYKYVQFKADLSRTGPNVTAELDKLEVTVDPTSRRGFWQSEVVDVSQATNKTTGKVSSDAVLGSDTLVTRSRYSTDGGTTFTDWANVLADGTMSTPANTTHVQIMQVLIGQNIEVKSSTVYFDGTPSAVLLYNGFVADAEYDFAQLRDILIIVNGVDAPRKWDTIGSVTLLGGSPPVLKLVETHLNKVWGVEKDNPSRVRWSDTLNPESWPALNFIDFNPEDGAEVTSLHRAGSYLFVGKANSVALITGDRDSNFSVMWLDSHERGPAGSRSVATLDKYIAYVGVDGVRISDLTRSVINSQKLIISWENDINHRRLNQAAVVFWDHYLLVALPSKTSLYNDTVWVLDTLRNAWSRIVGWSVSCWLPFKQYGQAVLLAGDSQTGQVYQVLTGDTDDGTAVEIDWKSGNLDLEYPERYKLFGNHTITVAGKAAPKTLAVTYTVIGGTTADGEFFDGEITSVVSPITVPAGDGQTHIYRILPPVWGAVLGRAIAIKVVTGADVHSMTIDMTVKGIVPGGL